MQRLANPALVTWTAVSPTYVKGASQSMYKKVSLDAVRVLVTRVFSRTSSAEGAAVVSRTGGDHAAALTAARPVVALVRTSWIAAMAQCQRRKWTASITAAA